VERPYHIVHKNDTQNWARYLAKNGQALLPLVCEIASQPTNEAWKYIKVPQKDSIALHPNRLADLAALQTQTGRPKWKFVRRDKPA